MAEGIADSSPGPPRLKGAAVDRGFDLALVSDAHSTESLDFGNGQVLTAQMMVAELNAAFKWLSVPNGRTEVKKTTEIAF